MPFLWWEYQSAFCQKASYQVIVLCVNKWQLFFLIKVFQSPKTASAFPWHLNSIKQKVNVFLLFKECKYKWFSIGPEWHLKFAIQEQTIAIWDMGKWERKLADALVRWFTSATPKQSFVATHLVVFHNIKTWGIT